MRRDVAGTNLSPHYHDAWREVRTDTTVVTCSTSRYTTCSVLRAAPTNASPSTFPPGGFARGVARRARHVDRTRRVP